ncbi:aromatic ring-hydroxylating dioxygenase subunit alpha [soil metagenome]
MSPGPDQPEALTLPARYYNDPEIFQAEIEHVFGRKWVYAGRADQIPGRGDYFLRQIGPESLIFVRDDRNQIRSYFNVCRHRGTRLCNEAEGSVSGSIQCPYHAWTYDLNGRLIGAPHMEDVAGFRKDDWPLKSVAVDLWEGHIFFQLAADPPSLADQLGDLPDRFRPWGMAELRLGHRITYDVAANWKLIVQNYSECLHCPVIHPALNRLSHYLSGENEPDGPPGCLGGAMTLKPGVATMTLDGQTRREVLPGLNAEDRRKVHYWAILPNLLLSLHPDYMMTHTLWPRAVDRTEIVCDWHFHPESLARPDFDPCDAVAFWDLTNRPDWQVSELTQLGMKSRAYAPGPYSHREDLLHAFDQFILRELGAL